MENYEAGVLVDTLNNVESAFLTKEAALAEMSDDGITEITAEAAQELAEGNGWDDLAGHFTHDFDSGLVDWEEAAAFWTLEMREYTETTELEFEPVAGVSVEAW